MPLKVIFKFEDFHTTSLQVSVRKLALGGDFSFSFSSSISSFDMMNSQVDLAIPPGGRILVTGANGNIGSHVVDVLLSLGYLVRGTVRSDKPWLNEFFDSKFGSHKFETTIVESLTDQEALTHAMKDVHGLIHVVCLSVLQNTFIGAIAMWHSTAAQTQEYPEFSFSLSSLAGLGCFLHARRREDYKLCCLIY